MPDYEERFVKLVADLEKLVEAAAKSEPEIAEDVRERLDATMPMLDDIQDKLASVAEEEDGEGETGGHE